MARQKHCITVGNSISGPPDPLPLRALGFSGTEPYRFLSKEPAIEDGQRVWLLEFLYEPTRCPDDCKQNCSRRDHLLRSGHRKSVEYVHSPSGTSCQTIRISIPRWFVNCGEVVSPSPLPGMADGYRMTSSALEFAIQELVAGTPVSFLARTLNESVSTIYRLKEKYIPKVPIELCIDPTMESFGIDEIKIGHIYYTILVDNTHRRFIGLIKGMGEDDIKTALIEIRDKCNIKRATADFSRDYIAILRSYFSDIVITGDKYHLIDKIKGKLTKFRRRTANALTREQIDAILTALNISGKDDEHDEDEYDAIKKKAKKRSAAGPLKKDADLFNTKFAKLDSKQRKRLSIWLKLIPQMEAPYRFLQRLYSLLDQRRLCPSKCYKRLYKLIYQLREDSSEQFFGLEDFLRNHFEEIVAYFETRETNAFAESMNSRIREMILLAHGLTPDEIIRRMCDRYGMVGVNSKATDGGSAPDLNREPSADRTRGRTAPARRHGGSRHGRHRRKKWPFNNSEESNPQLSLRFE